MKAKVRKLFFKNPYESLLSQLITCTSYLIQPGNCRSPLVWVLWLLQHPQFLKVWVLAPMVFVNFSHISINFHKSDVENAMNQVIPLPNVM